MKEVPILNVKGFDNAVKPNTVKNSVQKSNQAEDANSGEKGFLAFVAQMAEERGIPLNQPLNDEMIGEILADFKNSGQGDALSGEELLELLWQLQQGSPAYSEAAESAKIMPEAQTELVFSGKSGEMELTSGLAAEKTGLELAENSVPKAAAVDVAEPPPPNVQAPEPVARTISPEQIGTQKSFENQVMDQIVGKASLRVGDGQSEIRIDLKPPELGRILMNISTSDNQVTVKMLTEVPLVKEIIDNNLDQLKVELGELGMEIDEFDVSVARDFDRDGGTALAESSETGEDSTDMREQSLPASPDSNKEPGKGIDANRIDYFA